VGTTTKNLKTDNGMIMNDKVPFVLVHQYDRIPEWNEIITKKYE
jgi:hypothetical protein